MTTTMGWTQQDIKAFQELLIKANTDQLNAAAYTIDTTLTERARRVAFEELGAYFQ